MRIKEAFSIFINILGIPTSIITFVATIFPIISHLFKFNYTINIDIFLFISINVLILILFVFILCFIPSFKLYFMTIKANHDWIKLKTSIKEYHNSQDKKLRLKYEKIYLRNRLVLMKLCTEHQEKILKVLAQQRPSAGNYAPPILSNFKSCFYSNSLEQWEKYCTRNFSEIDCFEEIIHIMQSKK